MYSNIQFFTSVERRGGLKVLRLRRTEEQKQFENYNQQEKRG